MSLSPGRRTHTPLPAAVSSRAVGAAVRITAERCLRSVDVLEPARHWTRRQLLVDSLEGLNEYIETRVEQARRKANDLTE